jgi:hypothetical protein
VLLPEIHNVVQFQSLDPLCKMYGTTGLSLKYLPGLPSYVDIRPKATVTLSRSAAWAHQQGNKQDQHDGQP